MEPIKRREWSAGARACWRVFALCIVKPCLVILGWVGIWPRLLGVATKQMHTQFGNYQPVANDVLVCSYFKSGTNWTMQMALQVAWRGAAQFEHVHDLVPWPDLPPGRFRFAVDAADDRLYTECPTGLKVIKTHLALSQLPWNEESRYICVVRDPKDVFVSSYHFVQAVMGGLLMPTREQWLDLFLSTDTPFGSWAEHAAGFWSARHQRNVLFLTYESMKLDPVATIDRIAALMGVQLTPAEKQSVLRQSEFGYMKSITGKFDPIGMGPPWADPSGAMVRRGVAGGSAEMLSDPERRRIDDYWSRELLALGSDFPYGELYRA